MKLGMTVAQLRDTMGNEEYVRWGIYFAREAQSRQLEARAAR